MEGSENKVGGERGIRTPGTREHTIDFESTAFDHSAISPWKGEEVQLIFIFCKFLISFIFSVPSKYFYQATLCNGSHKNTKQGNAASQVNQPYKRSFLNTFSLQQLRGPENPFAISTIGHIKRVPVAVLNATTKINSIT